MLPWSWNFFTSNGLVQDYENCHVFYVQIVPKYSVINESIEHFGCDFKEQTELFHLKKKKTE